MGSDIHHTTYIQMRTLNRVAPGGGKRSALADDTPVKKPVKRVKVCAAVVC